MRVLAAAILISTALAAQTNPPKKATTTTGHRPAVSTRSKPLPTDPKATEGIAAVGTMPAATGPAASLFALRFIDLKIGDGELARPSMPPSNVVFYTVHYTGWTTNGAKFDSSVDRGEPIVFPIGLHRVISGWDLGFEGMRVGGKRRLIIPWQLAYGVAGHPPTIPEKADLVFDIELLGQGATQQPVTGTHFDPPAADAAAPAPAANPAPAARPAQRPEEHQE